MKTPKFLRDISQTAREQGWTVERTRGNHYKLQSPSGAVVFTSGTPSDQRAVRNVLAMLRRNGMSI